MPHRWLEISHEQCHRRGSCLERSGNVEHRFKRTLLTRMGDDCQFSISLLNIKLRGVRLYPKRIIIGGICDHLAGMCLKYG